MAALVLQYCVCLTASIRLRSTPHMDADCFYKCAAHRFGSTGPRATLLTINHRSNKIFGKLKASSFVQLAEGVAGKKCEEMPTVAECAMLGATLSGEDKCTWCVQGTITKCTKCKFAPMYFEQVRPTAATVPAHLTRAAAVAGLHVRARPAAMQRPAWPGAAANAHTPI